MTDWKTELLMAGQISLAAVLGGIIGYERERHGQEAGVRTFGMVALGACVFGLVSLHARGVVDTTRIASQVVVGIGFLGAGIVLHRDGKVAGLTTAATLWATAAVGLAVAFDMYIVALLTVVIVMGMLLARQLFGKKPTPGGEKPPSAS